MQVVLGVVHWVNWQQGSPGSPHEAHTPPEHVTPGAVQLFCWQQGCPGPPQVPHEPALHVAAFGQLDPCPTQRLLTQHPPPSHAFPAQHASPGPPHATHFWSCPHAVEGSSQSCPAQQASPGAPHETHMPPWQLAWGPQVLFLQHGSPGSPQ